MRGWLLVLSLSCAAQGHAQPADDPNLAHPHELVRVALKGRSIAGLATRLAEARSLKYGVVLFPGHPGILRLEQADGRPQFEQRGNFLVRSRRHWLDEETLVVLADAPSDEWTDFSQFFRAGERYGEDVRALVAELARRYGVQDWTFVGTSEGSVSAFHAARMNPALARRVILTASVFLRGRNGPGLSMVEWSELKAALLWVHHEDDPCEYTAYRDARRFAEKTKSALVTVRGGGPGRGGACQAFTAHGFVGVEQATVHAMRSWIKTGTASATVAP